MQRIPRTTTETERKLHHSVPSGQIITEDEEIVLRGGGQDEETAAFGEPSAQEHSELFSILSSSTSRRKRPTPVVEISSSLSGAGKTQLLYYLTARAILPRTFAGISVGGLEAAVVWMDADDRFDVYRLRDVARGIVRQAHESADDDPTLDKDATRYSEAELTDMLTSALQHVHVFRPQSSSALVATLCTLDRYLYDLSRHLSASRILHMLVIDSVTAFLWPDKLKDEVARTEEIGRSRAEVDQGREQKRSFDLSYIYAEIVDELRRLQGRLGCAVVYTTTVSSGRPSAWNNNGPSGSPGPNDRPPSKTPSLRPALPAPWGTFPILRLVVHRDTVRPFPPAMSAHDARKDAPKRQNVVQEGKFSAWVNAWGREEWPRRVVDGVNWYNGGCFSFYVRANGVEVPLPDN